jgi:hypothetical protein
MVADVTDAHYAGLPGVSLVDILRPLTNLTNSLGSLTSTLSGVTSGLTSTVGSVTSGVGGVVGGLTSGVGGVVGGVTSGVGGVVGGVTSTLTLGGLHLKRDRDSTLEDGGSGRPVAPSSPSKRELLDVLNLGTSSLHLLGPVSGTAVTT